MNKYRSYKFTNKHHSKGGIRSSIAAAVCLVCTIAAVYISYAAKGNGGASLAVLGVIAIISCCYGVIAGEKSFKEEESYYLFSRIGTSISLLLLICWIAILGAGYLL